MVQQFSKNSSARSNSGGISHLIPHRQKRVLREKSEPIIKKKTPLTVDVFLSLVQQELYLHGLHHKLSWSSPNKARHFFGVFASVSRRGRHKHTHRDKKGGKKKKKERTKKKKDTSLHGQKHLARA